MSARNQSGQISVFAAIVGAVLALFGIVLVSLLRTDVKHTVRTQHHGSGIEVADAGLERAVGFLRAPNVAGTPMGDWGNWRYFSTPVSSPTPFGPYTEIKDTEYQFYILPGDWTAWAAGSPTPGTDGTEITILVDSRNTKTGVKRRLVTSVRHFFGQSPWENNAISSGGDVILDGCVDSFTGTPTYYEKTDNCGAQGCQGNVQAGGGVSNTGAACGTVTANEPIALPTPAPSEYADAVWISYSAGYRCWLPGCDPVLLARAAPMLQGAMRGVASNAWAAVDTCPETGPNKVAGTCTFTVSPTSSTTATASPVPGTPTATSTLGAGVPTDTPQPTIPPLSVTIPGTLIPTNTPTCGSNIDVSGITYQAEPTRDNCVKITGSSDVCIGPGKYIVKDLNNTGNGGIRVRGASASNPVIIYVLGEFDLGGNAIQNESGDPRAVRIITVPPPVGYGGNFRYHGTSDASMMIYAPDRTVQVSGNPIFIGAIAAGSVSMNGVPRIRYPEQLRRPNIPASADVNVGQWREMPAP